MCVYLYNIHRTIYVFYKIVVMSNVLAVPFGGEDIGTCFWEGKVFIQYLHGRLF